MNNPLLELKEYEELSQAVELRQGPLQVTGTLDSQKVHLMYELGRDYPWKLVVTYDESRAREIYEDYRNFTRQVWLYPAKDLLFYAADIYGNTITRQRISVIRHMLEDDGGVVVTTIDGLMDHLLPLAHIAAHRIKLSAGGVLDLADFRGRLVAMGYERVAQVDGMGQFSIRGGIVDLYPLTEDVPVRIELWDDEIDSIRTFDLESQRSIESLDEILIYPAREVMVAGEALTAGLERIKKEAAEAEKAFRKAGKIEEGHRILTGANDFAEGILEGWKLGSLDAYIHYFSDQTVSFLDYFDQEKRVVYLDEPVRLTEKGETIETEFREGMAQRLEKGYLLGGQTGLMSSVKEVMARVQTGRTVCLTGLDVRLPGMSINHKYPFSVKNVNSYQNSFDLLIKDLTRWKKEKYRVVLLSASRTRAGRLASDLRDYQLNAYTREPGPGNEGGTDPAPVPADADWQVLPGEILVTHGNLHRGFEYPLIKYVIITEGDMFGVEKKKKKKKHSHQGKKILNFSQLAVGDYVVHEDHGLGIYRGIEKIERDKVMKDFIKVEYGDGGNLYILATRLDRIQKYAGADGKVPKLNKLGGSEWKKTKSKVRGAVQEIARELVELYAARQAENGFQYSPDTVWQREFEELFPFEETEDQLDAIDAVKQDMESKKIMDRLICGDVGYGKTEIALRAAFKAVQESKQVAYLVPTTILAQQHYNTFVQRMKDFPVRIDMMSRFRTPAQQKKTIEDLRKGLVDVVIGTHRILSKDIQFKDLGLLIIDEEQRFGVTHKEKVKQMKKNVEVMTLTATPIPRTLHMSLAGIRDMSVLNEPPMDRLPIQTYVMEYNEEMVREAISRELSRGGQTYYVYNRVNDIDELAARIQALVPDANVVFAHGQMSERELERIMAAFISGEIDVLVSTTIIETGLDIPNANTMIIHDADRMGLSQLYQLRGRVGRSSRTSYAFLMYRRNKILKEEAEKRLQAIREFTELGSGIRIAMRDLEIRGAGNVLGAKQHGHMEAVGYELYCKLLNRAVRAIQGGGEQQEEEFETTVECQIDAYIPPAYIKNEYQKLDIYKRISAIESSEEEMDMRDELIDRFGDLPRTVENLLTIAGLKAMAHRVYATEVRINRQEFSILLHPKAKLAPSVLPGVLEHFKGRLVISAGGESPVLSWQERKKTSSIQPMIDQVREVLTEMGRRKDEGEEEDRGE